MNLSHNSEYPLPTPSPSARMFSDALRQPVERLVSRHLGRDWRAATFSDLNDLASHPCSVLSDGEYAVFVKLSQAANGLDQFEAEVAGLRYLSEQAGVLTPSPLGNLVLEDGVIMVLEAVREVERTPRRWREIGQTLARIHRIRGEYYGLDRQGYFGPLYQDNRPMPDWLSFYVERRLWPRLMGAIDSGNLPTAAIRQVEQLIARLPRLNIPDTPPCLLHGDAQKNNFISTGQGAVVIDPAIYYGSPEIDLAYVDYFEPVPEEVFAGYRDVLPIDPGFSERKELWRVSAYLAAVSVEGATDYSRERLSMLNRAVQQYL